MRKVTFLPLAVLGLGVILVNGIREQFDMAPRAPMQAIRKQFAGLSGVDVPIDTAEQRVAGMSQFMLRNFGPDSALAFSVYVGYYNRQVQGRSIHSPKNCLPGAGWEILDASTVPLATSVSGRVNRVLLANKGARALVYYWYQGRGRLEANEYRVKWNLLRDAAVFGRTEEALARVVVPLKSGTTLDAGSKGVIEADALAQRVANELAVEIARVIPMAPQLGT